MSSDGRRAFLHRPVRGSRLRALRPVRSRGRLRHLPLPDAARERAGLLLLARPHDGRADPSIRVVRHQVAHGPARRHRNQIPDFLRAAQVLRSVARPIAEGLALSWERPPGSPSSTPSSTSSITSIRTSPASGASCAPTAPTRCARTVRSFTSRSRRWSRTTWRPNRIRRCWSSCSTTSPGSPAAWRCAGHDVPQLPVVSAALHGASGDAGVDCTVRVEPLKPLTQPVLYTENDLHVRQFTGSRTSRLARATRARRHREAY